MRMRVLDSALLRWQLETQQLNFVDHHDEYCWVYSLIKAGASQINDSNEYGFCVDLPYRDLPLAELRDIIDKEFYILSEAHYQRYMLTPDLFVERRDAGHLLDEQARLGERVVEARHIVVTVAVGLDRGT